ncbi:MAG: hypothetical protein Crog4KO_18810 [Crocinitomicaceae bacterium]
MVKAIIKRMHSPDILNLREYTHSSNEPFSFLLQMMISPSNQQGEESFDVIVRNPTPIEQGLMTENIVFHNGSLLVDTFNWKEVELFLKDFVSSLRGRNWDELALQIDKVASWEFRDYQEIV